MTTIIEIITEHLVNNGYDGLVNEFGDCACELGDLAPCGSWIGGCRPAYRGAPTSEEYDWSMYENKDEAVRSLEREKE